ncbi:hypothetical protein ACX80S_19390 [Arthrobacter sp. RHLT1-20]
MDEITERVPVRSGPASPDRIDRGFRRPVHENLTTRQMRAVGQRRHDAEEKLARHLEQARYPSAAAHISEQTQADQ